MSSKYRFDILGLGCVAVDDIIYVKTYFYYGLFGRCYLSIWLRHNKQDETEIPFMYREMIAR